MVDDISNANHHSETKKTSRNQKHPQTGGGREGLNRRNLSKIERNINVNEAGGNRNNHTSTSAKSTPHFNPEVVLDAHEKGLMTQGDRLNAIKARKQTQSLHGGGKLGNLRNNNLSSADPVHSRVRSVPAPLAINPTGEGGGGGGSGRGSSSATSTGIIAMRIIIQVWSIVLFLHSKLGYCPANIH